MADRTPTRSQRTNKPYERPSPSTPNRDSVKADGNGTPNVSTLMSIDCVGLFPSARLPSKLTRGLALLRTEAFFEPFSTPSPLPSATPPIEKLSFHPLPPKSSISRVVVAPSLLLDLLVPLSNDVNRHLNHSEQNQARWVHRSKKGIAEDSVRMLRWGRIQRIR